MLRVNRVTYGRLSRAELVLVVVVVIDPVFRIDYENEDDDEDDYVTDKGLGKRSFWDKFYLVHARVP